MPILNKQHTCHTGLGCHTLDISMMVIMWANLDRTAIIHFVQCAHFYAVQSLRLLIQLKVVKFYRTCVLSDQFMSWEYYLHPAARLFMPPLDFLFHLPLAFEFEDKICKSGLGRVTTFKHYGWIQ